MRITCTLLFFGISFSAASTAQAQQSAFQWAQSGESTGTAEAHGIAADLSGNAFVTGHFTASLTLGKTSLKGSGENEEDYFLAKYSPTGSVEWARKAGGEGNRRGTAVATDAAGNAYVTGYFTGKSGFEKDSLDTKDMNLFLAKYDGAGKLLWVKTAGGSGKIRSTGVAMDATGNAFITGELNEGKAFFGSVSLSSECSDVFLAKYDTNGQLLWARQSKDAGCGLGNALALDAGGNAYVTGQYYGTIAFGASTLTSKGERDMFLVKFSASGSPQWARSVGGTGDEEGTGIVVSSSGQVVATGNFTSPAINIGPASLAYSKDGQGSDIFLAKYDVSGEPLWAQRLGQDFGDSSTGVAIDGAGSIYLTGYMTEVVPVGKNTVDAGTAHLLVGKYDPAGKLLWLQRSEGKGYESGEALAIDKAGNAFLTGTYTGTPAFGNAPLAKPSSSKSMFVTKLGPVPASAPAGKK